MEAHSPSPKLVILEHNSLANEKYAKNGEQKDVHVVVKNTPFTITVGFADVPSNLRLDFNVVTIDAKLMYDCEGDRFVDFVKNKPLEFKGIISDASDKMTLEVRIKKLSSQLEDMFFKIRIQGCDSFSKKPIPSLAITSQPIKVVSKPEQIIRIKEGQKAGETAAATKQRTKKRSVNEMMFDSIQKIEKQQQEQMQLLKTLMEKEAAEQNSSNIHPVKNLDVTCKGDFGSNEDNLDAALHNFLKAYESINPSERPTKIRKIIRNIPARSVDALSEFTSHIQYSIEKDAEGTCEPEIFQDTKQIADKRHDDYISPDDLQRADDFYRDLLFSGAGFFPHNSFA